MMKRCCCHNLSCVALLLAEANKRHHLYDVVSNLRQLAAIVPDDSALVLSKQVALANGRQTDTQLHQFILPLLIYRHGVKWRPVLQNM